MYGSIINYYLFDEEYEVVFEQFPENSGTEKNMILDYLKSIDKDFLKDTNTLSKSIKEFTENHNISVKIVGRFVIIINSGILLFIYYYKMELFPSYFLC